MARHTNDRWFEKQGRRFARAIRRMIRGPDVQPAKFNVKILNTSAKVLAKVFNGPGQFKHVMELCQRLEDLRDSSRVLDLDIESIRNFLVDVHILRDRGGPLGQFNKVQLVFFVIPKLNEIIILRCFNDWSRYFTEEEIGTFGELFADYLLRGTVLNLSAPVSRHLARLNSGVTK